MGAEEKIPSLKEIQAVTQIPLSKSAKKRKKKKFSKHMAHVEISSVVLLPVPDFETTNVNA